jgi:Lipopolysaccharide-assembly
MKSAFLCIPTLLLVSCAGYQLGETKPAAMKAVKTIDVQMFTNSSFFPRANAVATSAVAQAIVEDGSYRIASTQHADAILTGNVASVKYTPMRGRRFDTLRPEELNNTLALNWTLRDAKNPLKILMSGTSIGKSEFFVTSNLQTDRNNALPDAAHRAGTALVSTLSNGF